jgi:hypothetical protein
MGTKTNVIDMTARRQAQLRAEGSDIKLKKLKEVNAPKSAAVADVVEFGSRKNEILTQERRRNRRTILSNFLGAFIIVPEKGLKEVALYDISEGGIAFDLENADGKFRVDEELALRVYLSKEIYVPITLKVKNVRDIKDEEVYRHGTVFVGAAEDDVLKYFIRFVEAMSIHLKLDPGDLKLPNQKS